MNVPQSAKSISADWLASSIGEHFPGSPFTNLQVSQIGQDYGYASQIFRCSWSNHGAEQSVVIKLWQAKTQENCLEIDFFQTFTDLPVRVPKGYFGRYDVDTQSAVLVLEDMQGDVLVQVSQKQATALAASLARLNAYGLNHPNITSIDWLQDTTRWQPQPSWIQQRRTEFLERFPNHLNGTALELLHQLERAPSIANDILENAPASLTHGDFHLDNVMFDSEPVLLDWSRPQFGPLALNIAELLFQVVHPDDFDEVLQVYVDEFSEQAPITLSNEDFEHQLWGAFLRIFTRSTCGTANWQPSSSRAKQIITHGIQRANQGINFWLLRNPQRLSL